MNILNLFNGFYLMVPFKRCRECSRGIKINHSSHLNLNGVIFGIPFIRVILNRILFQKDEVSQLPKSFSESSLVPHVELFNYVGVFVGTMECILILLYCYYAFDLAAKYFGKRYFLKN